MSRFNLHRLFGQGALLVAVGLGTTGPANALTGSMSWDPIYGAPFVAGVGGASNGMFWAGEANYFIPDACVGSIIAGATLTCSGMEVRNITVNLTDGAGGTTVETLDFSFEALSISKLKLDAGANVAWLETGLFDELVAGTVDAYNLKSYGFTIGFSEQGSRLYHASTTAVEKHKNGHDDGQHFWKGVGKGHFAEACGTDPTKIVFNSEDCGMSDTFAAVEFSPLAIPEPSTYALMLAGLGAVGFMARRRRR